MPDYLPGDTLTSLHFTPSVQDEEGDQFTFTITSFGVAIASGTYLDCGTSFLVPASGKVLLLWGGNLINSTSASTLLCPVIRTGGTVGSGSVVAAATNAIAQGMQGGSAMKNDRTRLYTGLTPGDTLNARLEHRVTAGTGTCSERHLTVVLAT